MKTAARFQRCFSSVGNDNGRRVVEVVERQGWWLVRRLDTGKVLVRSECLVYAYDAAARWNRAG